MVFVEGGECAPTPTPTIRVALFDRPPPPPHRVDAVDACADSGKMLKENARKFIADSRSIALAVLVEVEAIEAANALLSAGNYAESSVDVEWPEHWEFMWIPSHAFEAMRLDVVRESTLAHCSSEASRAVVEWWFAKPACDDADMARRDAAVAATATTEDLDALARAAFGDLHDDAHRADVDRLARFVESEAKRFADVGGRVVRYDANGFVGVEIDACKYDDADMPRYCAVAAAGDRRVVVVTEEAYALGRVGVRTFGAATVEFDATTAREAVEDAARAVAIACDDAGATIVGVVDDDIPHSVSFEALRYDAFTARAEEVAAERARAASLFAPRDHHRRRARNSPATVSVGDLDACKTTREKALGIVAAFALRQIGFRVPCATFAQRHLFARATVVDTKNCVGRFDRHLGEIACAVLMVPARSIAAAHNPFAYTDVDALPEEFRKNHDTRAYARKVFDASGGSFVADF